MRSARSADGAALGPSASPSPDPCAARWHGHHRAFSLISSAMGLEMGIYHPQSAKDPPRGRQENERERDRPARIGDPLLQRGANALHRRGRIGPDQAEEANDRLLV